MDNKTFIVDAERRINMAKDKLSSLNNINPLDEESLSVRPSSREKCKFQIMSKNCIDDRNRFASNQSKGNSTDRSEGQTGRGNFSSRPLI